MTTKQMPEANDSVLLKDGGLHLVTYVQDEDIFLDNGGVCGIDDVEEVYLESEV